MEPVYQERMSRYFIELSFKGTNYHGWQLQPNAITVQALIEAALKTLTRESIKTTGAGRTDAGVHAQFYVAHFDSECQIFDNKPDFIFKINALLKKDIAIQDIYRVLPNAHARYSALSRTYKYTISLIKDPFDVECSWYYSASVDLAAMNQSAGRLKDYIDFTSFSKLHSNAKTNICHIQEAVWTIHEHKLTFTIRADRFLRNMVRALVGTMIDVGRGKLSQTDFIRILAGKNRSIAGFSAPAEGLSLICVEYPKDIKI